MHRKIYCSQVFVSIVYKKQYTYYFGEKCWLVRIMGKFFYLLNGNIHSSITLIITINIAK